MQALADAGAGARRRRMVRDHQNAARLEHREQLLVHRGAIDLHVGHVVVEKEKGDEIEIAHFRRRRIVERPEQRRHALHRRRLHARIEIRFRLLEQVRHVLRIDRAVGRHRTCHQLGRVAAAGAHIEHLHPRPRARERKELRRIASLVDVAVGVPAVGRRDDRGIVGHVLRAGAEAENHGHGGEGEDGAVKYDIH